MPHVDEYKIVLKRDADFWRDEFSGGTAVDYFLYECGIVVAFINPVFPTTNVIADAIWDENISVDHQTTGPAGNKLNQALILYEGD